MAVRSREDLSYLDINRPVTDGLDSFLAHMRESGVPIFGYDTPAFSEEPRIEEAATGEMGPVMKGEGVQVPKLTIYQNGQLRLPMVELFATPQSKLKFGNALRRLINNPGESFPDYDEPAEVIEPDEVTSKRKPKQLWEVFDQLGRKHGVEDQSHLEIRAVAATTVTNTLLSHLGREMVLVLDTESNVGEMLLDQIDLSYRGLARMSRDIAYPDRSSMLIVPFGRYPKDASLEQKREFREVIKKRLPVSIALGDFRHNSGDAHEQVVRKKPRSGRREP